MLKHPLLCKAHGYWGGAFRPIDSPESFCVINPSTLDVLAKLPNLTGEHATEAIMSAREVLRTPPRFEHRVGWLTAIADVHLEQRESLASIIAQENGKPLREALQEVEYAAGFYRDAATRVAELEAKIVPGDPRGLRWQIHHRPAGVAGLITPWNFPLGMLAKKLAGALAAGCPSVVKPAEKTPLSAIALFTLLDRLGLPPGLCNLVFGDAAAIGKVMCTDPSVRVISFTGSTRVGQILAQQSAPHIKRLGLELGGNAPFVVFADADLDVAVEELMANKFRCAGQTCVCTNRVFVEKSLASTLVARISQRVAALRTGRQAGDACDVGPMIDGQAFDKVRALVADAIDRGARAVAGGLPDDQERQYYPPTVLYPVNNDMACCRQELFGPVIAVTEFESEEAVCAAANDTEYGLAAYVFSGDATRASRVASRLQFGHVGINTATGPTPEAPFGGMKHSGLGREGGLEGIMEYVELQTLPTRYDPGHSDSKRTS